MRKEEKKAGTWGLTCRIFIYLLVFLSTNIPSYAQSLKTYSGIYKLGKATYTYRDNPEGGRIYEGKFAYTYSYDYIGDIESGSATGYFENNKKEGAWTYIKNENTVLKVTYKKGVLDGLYDFSTKTRSGRKQTLSVCVKDRMFVGPIKGISADLIWSDSTESMVDFTGQFDENGNFDGKWVFKNLDSTIVYTAIYEHGICKKYYREDFTTGDFEHGSGNITSYLTNIIKRNFENLELMVDRNSKVWRWGAVDENCHQDESIQGETAREEPVFEVTEIMSQFPGGLSKMMKFISENIHYPEDADGIQGRVTLSFVVNKDGSISDLKVLRSLHEALDKEAVRVIKSMPKWKPGMQNGKIVRTRYTVPVMFHLN